MPLRFHASTCSPDGAIRTPAREPGLRLGPVQASPYDDNDAVARNVTRRRNRLRGTPSAPVLTVPSGLRFRSRLGSDRNQH